MLRSLKLVSLFFVVMFVMSIPVWAGEQTADITPALNQIQTQLSTQNTLSKQEQSRVMSKVRNELQHMARNGAKQEQVNETANQACRMIQLMTNNAGALKNLHSAVSLMAKEATKGKEPAEVGQMIRENIQECGEMTKALKQTRDQIREMDKQQLKDSSQNSGSSNNGSGNGGSDNGGGSGSGGNGNGGGSGSGGSGGGK